jgi:hypothetical protein
MDSRSRRQKERQTRPAGVYAANPCSAGLAGICAWRRQVITPAAVGASTAFGMNDKRAWHAKPLK